MENFIQGFIMSFREGLEAFLIIVILLKFLEKTNNKNLKKNVWHGLSAAIIASFVFGGILVFLSSLLGGIGPTAKLWESFASLLAVIFIATFIVWMINHGSQIKKHIEGKAALNLTSKGILLISFFMVAREGVEIALFQFAGKYSFLSIISGLALSIIFVLLIYHSLVKIKLQTIFTITLIYLILQSGFLMGYSVHEGLSAAKDLEIISSTSPLYAKAFDLSSTALNHKTGWLGIPLYVAIGWYSKPEIIQFSIQYGLTLILFFYWYQHRKKMKTESKAA